MYSPETDEFVFNRQFFINHFKIIAFLDPKKINRPGIDIRKFKSKLRISIAFDHCIPQ